MPQVEPLVPPNQLSQKLLIAVFEEAVANPDLTVGDVLDALGDVADSVTTKGLEFKGREAGGKTTKKRRAGGSPGLKVVK